MKFVFFFAFLFAAPVWLVRASEPAREAEAAIQTLELRIKEHPNDAVALFQEALQTKPAFRRQLFESAIKFTHAEPGLLKKLIDVARTEFPADDTVFADAAIAVAPLSRLAIREAFMTPPKIMPEALVRGDIPAAESEGIPSPKMDPEIEEAIARFAAKAEGRPWPPPHQNGRGEAPPGLTTPAPTSPDRSAPPLEAAIRQIATAGSVSPPLRPLLPHSRVYYIAPAAENHRVAIDQPSGKDVRPPLVIRPVQTSPTHPR